MKILILASAALCFLAAANPSARAVSLSQLLSPGSPLREIVYKEVDGRKLRLFMDPPPNWKPDDKRAAVICIHGGAWKGGEISTFFPLAAYFSSRGAVGFSLEYRLLTPEGVSMGDCLSDCKSALRYLRGHAGELGINPSQIIVLGDSAGGHLAAALGTCEGFDASSDDTHLSAIPNAMVLCNPIVDLTEGDWMRFIIRGKALEAKPSPQSLAPTSEQAQLGRQLSPLFHVKPGQPPAILMHGLEDKIVSPEQARKFAQTMHNAGNRCDLVLIEKARHAFIIPCYREPEPMVVNAIRRADEFLASLGLLHGAPTLEVSNPPAW